ncbi:hypothetical protein BH10PLA2_BH10PLA2_00360 [soil metagenome]
MLKKHSEYRSASNSLVFRSNGGICLVGSDMNRWEALVAIVKSFNASGRRAYVKWYGLG